MSSHGLSIRNYIRAKENFNRCKIELDETLLLKAMVVAELSNCINCTDTPTLDQQKRLLDDRLKNQAEKLQKTSCQMDFYWRRAMFYRRVKETRLTNERGINENI